MPHFAVRPFTLANSLVWLTATSIVFACARPGWHQVVAIHAIALAADAALFYVIWRVATRPYRSESSTDESAPPCPGGSSAAGANRFLPRKTLHYRGYQSPERGG